MCIRDSVVAVALLPELAEAAEVLTNLAAGEAHLAAQLSRGDAVDAGGLELVKLAKITRQAPYNVIRHFCLFHFISHHKKHFNAVKNAQSIQIKIIAYVKVLIK